MTTFNTPQHWQPEPDPRASEAGRYRDFVRGMNQQFAPHGFEYPMYSEGPVDRSNPRTREHGRQILGRLRMASHIDPSRPEATRDMRRQQWTALDGNYSQRVHESYESVATGTGSLEQQFDALCNDADAAFGREDTRKIEEVLQCMSMPDPDNRRDTSFLVERYGRQQVHVGRIHQYLDTYLNPSHGSAIIAANPKQRAFLDALNARLRNFIASDGRTEAEYQFRHPVLKSEQAQGAKSNLRFLAFLGLTGMAVLSGLLDLKNKKPSLATFIWAGLAIFTSGKLSGMGRNVPSSLASGGFEGITSRYGIRGADWAEIVENMQAPNAQNILQDIARAEKAKKNEPWKSDEELKIRVTKEDYLDAIAPRDPMSPAFQSVRNMPQEDLIQLASLANTARTPAQKDAMRQYVLNGMGDITKIDELAA